jgi:pyruvate ferredoxin oxidoreductase alpha subunit
MVDEFLPPINMVEQKMSVENPKSLCISAGNDFNFEFNIKQHNDMINSEKIIEKVDKDFGDKFGRYYNGMIENYKCDDAEVILITTGTITGTSRIVCDEMRKDGKKVGILKLRYLRPFPTEKINDTLKNAKAVGIIDKNMSFGYEGTIFTNVNSSLLKLETPPKTIDFIGGIGGKDITKTNIKEAFEVLFKEASGNKQERIQYMNVRCDK